MPFISVDGWSGLNAEQKKAWIVACTDVVVNTLHVPLDEVVIYIRDVEPGNWGQAGVVGTDPEWPVKSRRKSYGEI